MAAEPCSTATTRDMEQLEQKIDIRLTAAREQQDLYNELTEAALMNFKNEVSAKFETVNNLREQVTSERGVFVRRELLDIAREQFTNAIAVTAAQASSAVERVATRITELEKIEANSAGRRWAFGAGLGVVLTLISIGIALLGFFLRR